jgi:hypothetical protein
MQRAAAVRRHNRFGTYLHDLKLPWHAGAALWQMVPGRTMQYTAGGGMHRSAPSQEDLR